MIHPISNAPFTGSNKLEVPGTLTPYGTSVPSTTGPSNFVQAGKLNASKPHPKVSIKQLFAVS